MIPAQNRQLPILSLSPNENDHQSLQVILAHPKGMIFKARDCERDLLPGSWSDVLVHIQSLPNAPSLIVASRLADDRLWGEALNLGAWDVLAKPFDPTEVIRSLHSAWRRWHDQIHMRATGATMMEAAS